MKLPPLPRKKYETPRRRQIVERDESTRQLEQSNRSFMRNRTISGSAKPVIEDTSKRSQMHQLAKRRRRVGLVFGLLIGICLFLVLIISQFTAQVTVGIGSTAISKPIDTSLYIKTINTYLDHHPVERLRFTLSQSQLNSYVSSVNPEVASVSQKTIWGLGHTEFTITLRQPVAGWQISSQQYFVDEHGVAFSRNYFSDPTVQIIDQSGLSPQTGTAVTSTRFLSFVGKIVSIAKGRGYTVTQAILPTGTTREIEIRLDGYSSIIKLSIDRGAGEQIEDMDRSLIYLKSKGQNPVYIDLRIAGRAFYA